MTEISLYQMSFAYRHHPVYEKASLTLTQPGVYGLVGPNGSGKSTLFDLLCGLLRPQTGTITLDGAAPSAGVVFNTIAYGQDAGVLYPRLSGADHLRFVAKQHGRDAAAIAAVSAQLDLAAFVAQPVGSLSMGQKQRVAIALALLPQTPVLLLDEPLNGLDPDSVIIIRKLLVGLQDSGRIVLVSSHNLAELEKVTNHYLFKVGTALQEEVVTTAAEARYEELFHRAATE
ncbi:ATP-binding cassette domain-containing protein [Lacticaseibacillus kribbianus]|uniref:ATP-binding cassette domain-containing protein n=1 Tax=Lacticaseibacillus kribbianus TaxID=2926292 RepID=UPI001CD7A33F|nr:ATP-binding cassette domain-containing protein [Lacticaseibacillus kribbianus]